MPLMTTDGNLLSDTDIKEAAQTASAEIKRQAKRIAELEADNERMAELIRRASGLISSAAAPLAIIQRDLEEEIGAQGD